MSARQPFLPTRPASRALNLGDDANATLPNNPPSGAANDTTELGKRALNISGLKKAAPRSSFGAEFETRPRSAAGAKGGPAATTRIYAPHPSTPPVLPPGFPTPEFKTPSLPFSRSIEGPHTDRPKSCRPRPPEQSFFGNPKFPFESSSGDLDDSGYFSDHADDAEVDRFGSVANNPDITATTRFVNSTKRGRPASPSGNHGGDEDANQRPQRDLPPKRPCIRRANSPSSRPRGSHNPTTTANTAPMLESAAPASEGAAFVLPSHIPHPTAAMGGELPGLEFSETDLARYAELYERGSERWSKAPMEEWVAGADEVLAKFGDMIDMIKDHMSSKMNLYKSLHNRLSDEHSALDHRAKELRDASQSLVRDSGTIGGALGSHEIDARAH